MKKFLLLALPFLGIVGCSKSEDSAQTNATKSAATAPGPAVAPGGGAAGGAPQAQQGGHFSNPNATVPEPGSALGKR